MISKWLDPDRLRRVGRSPDHRFPLADPGQAGGRGGRRGTVIGYAVLGAVLVAAR